MKTLGNILWFIFGGLITGITYFIYGLICCVTIILIPVGIQMFKLAGFTMFPFGKQVTYTKSGGKVFINVIYAILFGWELALVQIALGIAYCLTIIGIPFGLQYFKLATFVFMPLGATFD